VVCIVVYTYNYIHMASKQITVRDYNTEIPGRLSEDALTWYFPQVCSVNSHGKKTQWQIYVRAHIDDTAVPIKTAEYNLLDNRITELPYHGVLRKLSGVYKVDASIGDGVVRLSAPTTITEGKNLKSKSATTPFCQTLREAYSLHNKQLRKAVKEQKGDEVVRYPPMLAQVISRDKVATYLEKETAYVQRKYNGVRTVTTIVKSGDGETVVMYSRRGVLYPGFDHIKKELLDVLSGYLENGQQLYLDGEIYKHGVALQDISGSARREGADTIRCDYMVYDCFIPGDNSVYSARKALLSQLFETFEFEHVKEVPTWTVGSLGEIDQLYAEFLRDGYEGAMVRLDRAYKYSYNEHHSSILLKIKQTLDAEFEIVRWETGIKGKAAGALMMVCKTPEGHEFPVTPAMEIPDRIKLAERMSSQIDGKSYFDVNYKGKPLIVYYDELSSAKVPQRARTKMEIRTWD
jgi:ATP-dependent DNA ligase